MGVPTLTISQGCPLTVAPGANVTIDAVLSPAKNNPWINWLTPGPFGITTNEPSQSFTAPTTPGTYAYSFEAYWERIAGNTNTPIPGGGNFNGPGAQVSPVTVCTNETWTNTAADDIRVTYKLYPSYGAVSVAFEGFYLGIRTSANDYYFAYIVWSGTDWYIQIQEIVGGVTNIPVAGYGPIALGDDLEFRATNGDVEFFHNGTNIYTATSGAVEFCGFFSPFVSGMSQYVQPVVTNNTVATIPQTGTCSLTVAVPPITGAAQVTSGVITNYSVGNATGGTWASTCGSINASGEYTPPCVTTQTTCQITYTVGVDVQTFTVTVNPMPAISIPGGFMAVAVGQELQFAHTIPSGTWSASSGTIDSTGLFTPTTAGSATITYTPATGQGCAVTKTVTVYPQLVLTPALPTGGCHKLQRGETLQFAVSGGSGDESFDASCGTITQDGLFTAPANVVDCEVIVTDNVTGQTVIAPICTEGAAGLCVAKIPNERTNSEIIEEDCPEYQVECGESLSLAVPGVALHSTTKNLKRVVPSWQPNASVVITQPFSQLTANVANAAAAGNCFDVTDDFRLDVLINQSMLSAGAITVFGFSAQDQVGSQVGWAIGVNASGLVEVYEGGVSRGTFGAAVVGQSLSISYQAGTVSYYKAGRVVTQGGATNCGQFCLVAMLGEPHVFLGGAANPNWRIVSGSTGSGTISTNGTFRAGQALGIVDLEAEQNGSLWRSRIRIVKGVPRRERVDAIWSAQAELWLNVAYLPHGERLIVTADGSPDFGQNPNAINLGDTRDGFSATYKRETSTTKTDRGRSIISKGTESYMIEGDMVEVRDSRKLRYVLDGATFERRHGYNVIGFGGNNCTCETSAVLIIPSPVGCSTGETRYDYIYLPRVQAVTDTLSYKFNSKDFTSLPFKLEGILDTTRTPGFQLAETWLSDEDAPAGATVRCA